jgi:2-methylisocitrate lyase-like PEP mutase family enzyme
MSQIGTDALSAKICGICGLKALWCGNAGAAMSAPHPTASRNTLLQEALIGSKTFDLTTLFACLY